MPKLRSVRSAPLALAYWLGIAGAAQRRIVCARFLMFHATPRGRARQLERVLRYLKRRFDVVPLASLADSLDSPTAPLRRKLVLTFDDGLRNNLEVAYPVLQRLGLPATFFVCPGLIEQGQWLWNHEARQRMLTCRMAPAQVETVIDKMKKLGLEERQREEERIRAATPAFAPTAAERHEFDLAGWDALRRLD